MIRSVCGSCGVKYSNKLRSCPNCGAQNPSHIPVEAATEYSFQMPKTIKELEQLLEKNRLSPSEIRLHLREDYPGPQCFGIFQDEAGNFVVYKNRIDGTRLIRYQGPDEAYAVSELVQKTLERVEVRRALHVVLPHENGSLSVRKDQEKHARSARKSSRAATRRSSNWHITLGLLSPLLISLLLLVVTNWKTTENGYYCYQSSYFYYQSPDWYISQGECWYPIVPIQAFSSNCTKYYCSASYSESYGVADFSTSNYYNGPHDGTASHAEP